MESGDWRGEAWPGPESRARQRLPRVEDLPAAENGYDRERVREAFEAFYRHIAQLDSTLRALEAVEVFRDQAGELRKELRALKAAGWTQQPWPSYASARSSPGLPESLPRFAIEAVFLVVVAVVVAVAGFDRLSIVLVMALAWAIVGVVEWASSRERFARKAVPTPARAVAEPVPPQPLRVVSAERAEAWEDAPPAQEAEAQDEELTVVEATGEAAEGEAAEGEAVEVAAEAEVEAEAKEPAVVEAPHEEPAAAAEEPEPVEAAEPEPEAAEEVEEPEPEPAAAAGSWSWAADAAVDRAREREQPSEERPPKRRFWQRRKHAEDGYRFDSTQPRHVRVLPPAPSFDEQFPVEPADRIDPWEQELDLADDGTADPTTEAEAGETPEHAYAEARPDGDADR